MTKEEIRSAYMAHVEPLIEEAERFADEPALDKLRAVCNSPHGYSLFYPMSGAFRQSCMDFDALIELYSYLQYCWLDDGYTAFVCATICIDNQRLKDAFPDRDFKFNDYRIFVMRGEHNFMPWDTVEKVALTHDSMDAKMVSYEACIFEEENLDFLHGLVPEYEEMAKICKDSNTREGAIAYRNAEKAMDERLRQHIITSKYSCSVTPDETKDRKNWEEQEKNK